MVTFHSKEIINLWTDFHSSFQIQQKIRCLIKAAFLPKHTNLGLQLGITSETGKFIGSKNMSPCSLS